MKIKGFDSVKLGDGNEERDSRSNNNIDYLEKRNSEYEVLKGITEDQREHMPDDDYERIHDEHTHNEEELK